MKWFKRILVALVLLLLVGYFGIPMLLETSWARDQIRESMAEKTGREVEIGDISFSWLKGLRVSDVTVSQRPGDRATDGPLFELGSLNLSLGLGDILDRKIDVEEFTVVEPRIVIVRDKSGRFNFSDLLDRPSGSAPASAPGPSGGEKPPAPAGGGGARVKARVDIEDGRILYIDEPLGTRVEASGIEAEATYDEGRVSLTMTFVLNGGDVRLRASGDLSRTPSPFEVEEFTIDGSEFSGELAQLGLFIPLMGDRPKSASGKLTFSLKGLSGTGLDLESLRKTLTGTGDLSLTGGALVSGPVTQLYSAFQAIGAGDLGALAGGGSNESLSIKLLNSSFKIEDGKIVTDDMSLAGSGIDLSLSGWTRLDGKLKYRIEAENLNDLLARNKTLSKYLGGSGKLPLSLKGFLSAPEVSVDVGAAVKSGIERAIKEKIGERIPGGLGGLLPGGKDDDEKKKKER